MAMKILRAVAEWSIVIAICVIILAALAALFYFGLAQAAMAWVWHEITNYVALWVGIILVVAFQVGIMYAIYGLYLLLIKPLKRKRKAVRKDHDHAGYLGE